MPAKKGTKSKTHSGLDYMTRKGSKYYVHQGHRVKPFAQKTGGFSLGTVIKLLGGGTGRKRRGGALGYATSSYPVHRGFY